MAKTFAERNPPGLVRIVVESIFFTLSVIVVLLRLYSRKLKHLKLSFNDYAIIVSLVFTAGLYANGVIKIILGGHGQHTVELHANTLLVSAKTSFAANLLWCTSNTAIKLSALHLYITIFPSQNFRRITYGVMAFCALCGIAYTIGCFTLCPYEDNFIQTSEGPKCDGDFAGFLITGVINLLTDIIVVFLPMRLVWKLKMKRQRKIGIIAIFGLGAIICIITIVRLKFTFDIDYKDFNYSINTFSLLASLEIYLGNITASLPLLASIGAMIARTISHHTSTISHLLASVSSGSKRLFRRRHSEESGSKSEYHDLEMLPPVVHVERKFYLQSHREPGQDHGISGSSQVPHVPGLS